MLGSPRRLDMTTRATVWSTADRIASTMADLVVGTAIVFVHVALAGRERPRRRELLDSASDGTRIWRTQISP
jgi:hypothetical protein